MSPLPLPIEHVKAGSTFMAPGWCMELNWLDYGPGDEQSLLFCLCTSFPLGAKVMKEWHGPIVDVQVGNQGVVKVTVEELAVHCWHTFELKASE